MQFFTGTELYNDYNHIMLIDHNEDIVHKAWYADDPPLNVSLIESEILHGEWVQQAWPTPGQPEPSTTSITGEVAFNEILPDAVGNDTDNWPNGEWIELVNTGNQTVDLANWYFKSGSRNFNINVHQLPMKDNTVIMQEKLH